MDRNNHLMQSTPPLLPNLVRGQQIRNGPFVITVTDDMVHERERENRKIFERWLQQEKRRIMIQEEEEYFGEFGLLKVRRRFIRRVFSVLTLQLICTAFIISTFMFVDEARQMMLEYPYLWMLALGVFIITFLSIVCCDCARRTYPCNVIFLILLTLSLSYLTAAASITYSTKAVLFTAAMTTVVSIVICTLATCTKFDLTKEIGLLMIVGIVAMVGMLAMIITYYFTKIKILEVAISVVGSLLMSMYLFYDVQTIMGGRVIELSPDEIIYATMQLYIDIMYLYKYLLILGGFSVD